MSAAKSSAFGFRPARPPTSSREAAVWWALQGDEAGMSVEMRQTFKAWLDGDPARRVDFEQARKAMTVVEAHAGEADILALRQRALAARRDPDRFAWVRPAAVAALALALALGGYGAISTAPWLRSIITAENKGPAPNSAVHQLYRTSIGERAAFNLPDGSVATLDTDSLLQVNYSRRERAVKLLKGQALFEVAKHKPVPFQAYVGDRRITAIGTLFDVRLDRNRIKVALIEGRIRVTQIASGDRGNDLGAAIVLGPGEALDTGPGAPMRVSQSGVSRPDSWKDGVVVFDDTRLVDALAELNRYNLRPIVIKDASIRNLRVTGVFKTGQPDRFAQTITEIFPVTATYNEDGDLTLRSR